MLTEDLPEWLVEHVAATEMEPRFAYLNDGAAA
jgi:hypothetical protein